MKKTSLVNDYFVDIGFFFSESAGVMTEQEINETIAKACGWKRVETPQYIGWVHDDYVGCRPGPPDYCNDLNDMYDAEATQTGQEWSRFVRLICNCDTAPDNDITIGNAALAIHSKAMVRARCWLMVKGLLKD